MKITAVKLLEGRLTARSGIKANLRFRASAATAVLSVSGPGSHPARHRTLDAAFCGGPLVSADAEAQFRFSVPQSLPPPWAIPPKGACHADTTI
jgi:hypothetical protein